MTILHMIMLLAISTVAGFANGFPGVGGAGFITPVQYMVFTDMGLPSDIAVKLSFGTTLTVVLFTAISGSWRHYKKKAVVWKAAIIMGCCGSIAAFGEATLTALLPGEALKLAFGAIFMVISIRMLIAGKSPEEKEPKIIGCVP
ncbi:MAG: sulfite exporter TauE/SafE family protein [Dehalococcoidales bacterium]|nr:sulfite exporter TauE/SafE family protein [Dehalococcoidales bacterium]